MLFRTWPLERISKRLVALPKHKLLRKVSAKTASVLLPLCTDVEGRPAVLFTVRSPTLRAHAGEICFPGGRSEPNDASSVATALRETEEELGIQSSRVRILGQMHAVPSKGGLGVTPVVGYLDGLLDPKALKGVNEEEVSAVFTLPLEHLLKPESLVYHEIAIPREDYPRKVPAFRLTPEQQEGLPYHEGADRPAGSPLPEVSVWGMTGYLLHTFLFDVMSWQRTAGGGLAGTAERRG